MEIIAPRKRTMPLVPEPFERVCLAFSPIARNYARFCPNLDIPRSRETLSEEKQTELDKRASRLARKAIGNQLYKASEFGWEVHTWHDAFGLMMDDPMLMMDKKPYEYLQEENDSGKRLVRTRIPDGTFGLRTYDDFDFEHGYDHDPKWHPDRRLSQDRLRDMMHNPECGLVVDGRWGETSLVFPFAVYEAKKTSCRTYLAMLDDLARNPDNISEYQTKESKGYQLFAFTSAGSNWRVYVAFNFLSDCHVETLWAGDVKHWSCAFDLLCIVDQIHEYAIKIHRPFVMKHLEAWHARHERLSVAKSASPDATGEATPTACDNTESRESSDAGMTSGSNAGGPALPSSGERCDPDWVTNFNPQVVPEPEWRRLKREAKWARLDKAQETRERNRMLRRLVLARTAKEVPQKGSVVLVIAKGGTSLRTERWTVWVAGQRQLVGL